MSTNNMPETIHVSDWITQADAARLRGVSRQAIAKLVKSRRLRTLDVGGRLFVNREEVQKFIPHSPGRPRGTDDG